jgi:hypothetical protein
MKQAILHKGFDFNLIKLHIKPVGSRKKKLVYNPRNIQLRAVDILFFIVYTTMNQVI